MPQFWAGFTLGGHFSRPAPCSEDIPCRTVCHIPCTIQVGIQSISATLAMYRVPVTNRRTSKSAPRASAAVERRECRGERPHREVFSEGFVFNEILQLSEVPVVNPAVLSPGIFNSTTNVFEVFHRNTGILKAICKFNQSRGNLMVKSLHVVGLTLFSLFDFLKEFPPGKGLSIRGEEFSFSACSLAICKCCSKDFAAQSSGLSNKEIVDTDVNSYNGFALGDIWLFDFLEECSMQIKRAVLKNCFSKLKRTFLKLLKHVFVTSEPEMYSSFQCQEANPWNVVNPLHRHAIFVVSNPWAAVKMRKSVWTAIAVPIAVLLQGAVCKERFNSFVSRALSKLSRQTKIVAHKCVGSFMQDVLIAAPNLFANLESIVARRTTGFSRRAKQSLFSFSRVFDFIADGFCGSHNLIVSEAALTIKEMRLLPARTNVVSAAMER